MIVDGKYHEYVIAENASLRAENEKLRGEVTHWRKNHDHKVEQLRIFKQREDLPVDRLPAYRRLVELQAENEKLRAENEKLQKSLQDMTIRYSESIDEKVGLRGDNEKLATKQFVLDAVILSLHEDIEDLRAAMHDIYEVYAGSEGFHPQTCPEAYLQEHIKEMADIAAKHKRAAAAALKETGDE